MADVTLWRDGLPVQLAPGKSAVLKMMLPDAVVGVNHFTWWNCDARWTDKHCFDVLVTDSMAAPVPNMRVDAEGINYQGSSVPRYTAANGHACVNIRRRATAKIRIGTFQSPLASTTVTGMGPTASCQGNGGSCTQMTMVIPNYTVCSPGAKTSGD